MREHVLSLRTDKGEVLGDHSSCWLCEDLFEQMPRFADEIVGSLEGLEYRNFLVGTKVDCCIQDREERLWAEVGGETAEPIKAELNREIGKLVGEKIGLDVEFDAPDVVALIDTRFCHVKIDLAPLFLYGRYLKLSREIPKQDGSAEFAEGRAANGAITRARCTRPVCRRSSVILSREMRAERTTSSMGWEGRT